MTLPERAQLQESAEYSDLCGAVKMALDKRGVLARMRAEMLYSVFQCAKGESPDNNAIGMGNLRAATFAGSGMLQLLGTVAVTISDTPWTC